MLAPFCYVCGTLTNANVENQYFRPVFCLLFTSSRTHFLLVIKASLSLSFFLYFFLLLPSLYFFLYLSQSLFLYSYFFLSFAILLSSLFDFASNLHSKQAESHDFSQLFFATTHSSITIIFNLLSMQNLCTDMNKIREVVFTFTRQRWSSITFSPISTRLLTSNICTHNT